MIVNWKRALSGAPILVALAVAVTVFASAPAQAGQGCDWGGVELTNTGAEPQASGQASLTDVDWVRLMKGLYVYSGKLSVTCQNLTPGATYSTPVGTFTANRKGDGKVSGRVSLEMHNEGPWVWVDPFVVDVVRVDPDGPSPTVLTGTFPGQFWY